MILTKGSGVCIARNMTLSSHLKWKLKSWKTPLTLMNAGMKLQDVWANLSPDLTQKRDSKGSLQMDSRGVKHSLAPKSELEHCWENQLSSIWVIILWLFNLPTTLLWGTYYLEWFNAYEHESGLDMLSLLNEKYHVYKTWCGFLILLIKSWSKFVFSGTEQLLKL